MGSGSAQMVLGPDSAAGFRLSSLSGSVPGPDTDQERDLGSCSAPGFHPVQGRRLLR